MRASGIVDVSLALGIERMLTSGTPEIRAVADTLLESLARGEPGFGLSGRHARDRLADVFIGLAYAEFLGEPLQAALARRPRPLSGFSRALATVNTRDRFARCAARLRPLPDDSATLVKILDRFALREMPVSRNDNRRSRNEDAQHGYRHRRR